MLELTPVIQETTLSPCLRLSPLPSSLGPGSSSRRLSASPASASFLATPGLSSLRAAFSLWLQSWRREHLTVSRPPLPASGHCHGAPSPAALLLCVARWGASVLPRVCLPCLVSNNNKVGPGDHMHTLPVKLPHFWALPAAPAAAVATDAWPELPLPAAQSGRFVTPLKKMPQGSTRKWPCCLSTSRSVSMKSWSHISMY